MCISCHKFWLKAVSHIWRWFDILAIRNKPSENVLSNFLSLSSWKLKEKKIFQHFLHFHVIFQFQTFYAWHLNSSSIAYQVIIHSPFKSHIIVYLHESIGWPFQISLAHYISEAQTGNYLTESFGQLDFWLNVMFQCCRDIPSLRNRGLKTKKMVYLDSTGFSSSSKSKKCNLWMRYYKRNVLISTRA